MGRPGPENHEHRRVSYGEASVTEALPTLAGDRLSNRETAIFIANQDIELK
jgi:hypothetical protein